MSQSELQSSNVANTNGINTRLTESYLQLIIMQRTKPHPQVSTVQDGYGSWDRARLHLQISSKCTSSGYENTRRYGKETGSGYGNHLERDRDGNCSSDTQEKGQKKKRKVASPLTS